MNYEYVMSGVGHAHTLQEIILKPDAIPLYRGYLKSLNAALNPVKASLLFNGFTEKRLGETLQTVFDKEARYYVDSGGLQMITCGQSVTDERKETIYEVQGSMADFAMSFDEIPVVMTQKQSRRNDMTSRYVDMSIFDDKARESGINIKNQIQSFIKQGSSAKPFLIVQGHDLNSYQRWADIILDELTDDEISHIGGFAVGAAALGAGAQEDFHRALIGAKIQLPEHIKNHIHLLGIGSMKRMLPYIVLRNQGLISDNILLSLDSTTHTSAPSYGNFQLENKIGLSSYSGINPTGWEVVLNDLDSKYKSIFGVEDIPRQFIKDAYLMPLNQLYKKYPGDDNIVMLQRCNYLSLFVNVYNFCQLLISCDKDIYNYNYDTGFYYALKTFESVKTEEDFYKWQTLNKSLSSKKVRVQTNSNELPNVEEFFR